MLSYTLGAIANISLNFLFHRSITFTRKDSLGKRLSKFFMVTLFVFLISWLMILATTELLGLHYLLSVVIVTFIVSVINFFLNKCWVFKKHNSP